MIAATQITGLNDRIGKTTPINCSRFRTVLFLVFLLLVLPLLDTDADPQDPAHFPEISSQWGGYVRDIGTLTLPDSQSVYRFVGTDPLYDGRLEGRLKNDTFFGEHLALETHLELTLAGGDTRRRTADLREFMGEEVLDSYFGQSLLTDDRRLFNLTHVVADEDAYQLATRFDRLHLSYASSWGAVHLGRQALTWGNGLIFNPMDLFQPFSPSAVMRDYKQGDDMAVIQAYAGPGEIQLAYAPHRSMLDGSVTDRSTTYAAKWHQPVADLEWDAMAARHYGDHIIGMGLTGYLGGAAWRMNSVYTFVNQDTAQNDFLQVLLNMDYAWQWFGHNVYGFGELYFNGIGKTGAYMETLSNSYVAERISRGDQFVLGQWYVAGQLQIEHHPLVHSHWTAIVNPNDPSGLIQPQVMVDVTSNWQIIAGAGFYWGGNDTEFGGFPVSEGPLNFQSSPADMVYLWLTYYF